MILLFFVKIYLQNKTHRVIQNQSKKKKKKKYVNARQSRNEWKNKIIAVELLHEATL